MRPFPLGRLVAWLLALSALLAGCAQRGPAPAAAEAAQATAQRGGLLAVRLQAAPTPPRFLALAVTSEQHPDPAWVQGRLQQGVPGQQADYLFALPPGRWQLREVADPDAGDRGLLATLNLSLAPDDRPQPAYLGRLVLRWNAGTVSEAMLEDRYDDDTLAFRAAVPALRAATLRRQVQPQAGLLAGAAATPGAAAGPSMQASVAAPDDAQELPPRARLAWRRYLGLPLPRAFALGPQGTHGLGSGADAAARALRDCTRQAGGPRCRLVAVDQTRVGLASDGAAPPR